MRRDQLILLLQPYKNGLMPKKGLAAAINRFAALLLELCKKYPRLRFNVALPGYILESIDPLVLSALRDMAKRGSVEWLCMGYTEPFLSFSPLWLTSENIALGVKVFTELTGEPPQGYVPPFSNWVPSHIDTLCGAGMKYAVVINEIVAKSEAGASGYWITEYTGSSIALFPARSRHGHNAPDSLAAWAKEIYPDDKPGDAPNMLILKYLYPLEDDGDDGSGNQSRRGWIEKIAAEMEKRILELQPLRFRDVLGNIPPLGLQYLPPSIVPSHNEPATPYFLNHLHCYDQIGVMQRKMMNVCDAVRELGASKLASKLRRKLFFAQDINRYLPSERAGFCSLPDRLWTYSRMIDIERELYELRDTQNGVIQLTDFLRNGYKSVIMSNRALKMCIDHKNGAQVYELDYRERLFNACAAYNPAVRSRPNVIVPRESRLGFCDKIFTCGKFDAGQYAKGAIKDCANFADSPFEYTFKNSPSGVRVLLNCNGGFTDGEGRMCPLTMDKVFGLEKDSAELSFSYKLGNTALTDYSFILGVELPLSLPGSEGGNARFIDRKAKTKEAIGDGGGISAADINEWAVDDDAAGVRMEFVTQKNVDVHLLPGGTLLIICPAEIEKNSTFSFTGRLTFKKIKSGGGNDDSL